MKKTYYTTLLITLNFLIIGCSSNVYQIKSNLQANNNEQSLLKSVSLKLEVDKKEFSPNGDGVNDSVNFTVTVPKNKSWTLDITSEDYMSLTVDNAFTKDDFMKTISGVGTGEPQVIFWNGSNNVGNTLPQTIYKLQLKSDDKIIEKQIEINGQEELKVNLIRGYPEIYINESKDNYVEKKLKFRK